MEDIAMRGPHNIFRLIRTGVTLERTGAMYIALEAMEAPRGLRILARVVALPFKWLGLKGDLAQPPVLRALTALGPAYIKFGQLLSTRPDVVGTELANELQVLQDRLPPFQTEKAKAAVSETLGVDVDKAFSSFGPPIAAASIAQVHQATVKETGQKVAVKVLRPNIEKAFQRDIDAFHLAAGIIELLSPEARRLRASDVVRHFESVVRNELDLRVEAAAASEFRDSTSSDQGFLVPQVVWGLSSRRAMTMDWAEGLALGDAKKITKAGHDPKDLASRIIQIFLHHALRDGYFHADMHQGNLKVASNGDIIALDFGIMGRIDIYTRRVYAEILYGFIKKDYRRVAEVHFEAGYVPKDQDVDEFALALRSVGEPIFGMDASRISMARLLGHLFEVTERFGMQTRTELILLQRTMVVVEGVARSLDPGLNMWNILKPVVEEYIHDNVGARAFARDMAETARILVRLAPRLHQVMDERLFGGKPDPEKKRPWKGRLALLACLFLSGAAAGLALSLVIG